MLIRISYIILFGCGVIALALLLGYGVQRLSAPVRGGVGEPCFRDGTCINGLVCRPTVSLLDEAHFRCSVQ